MAPRVIAVPPASRFLEARDGSALLVAWVQRWTSDERVLVTGMWPLLAQLLGAGATRIKSTVVSAVKANAGGLGPGAESFVRQLEGVSPEWRVKTLALLVRHPSAVRALARLARDRTAPGAVRCSALRALGKTRETTFLRRTVSGLAGQVPLAQDANETLATWDSRRSSSLEEVAAAKVGTTLRDRSALVAMEASIDLGSIDFGSEQLEFWDPVQTGVLPLRVALPGPRAFVTALLSGGRAVVLRLRFARGRVSRWQRIGEVSSPFGTLVLSQRGVARQATKH